MRKWRLKEILWVCLGSQSKGTGTLFSWLPVQRPSEDPRPPPQPIFHGLPAHTSLRRSLGLSDRDRDQSTTYPLCPRDIYFLSTLLFLIFRWNGFDHISKDCLGPGELFQLEDPRFPLLLFSNGDTNMTSYFLNSLSLAPPAPASYLATSQTLFLLF